MPPVFPSEWGLAARLLAQSCGSEGISVSAIEVKGSQAFDIVEHRSRLQKLPGRRMPIECEADCIELFRKLDHVVHDGTSDLLNHPTSKSTVVLEIHYADGRSTTLVDLLASSSSATTVSARELSSLFTTLSSGRPTNHKSTTLTKVLAETLTHRPHCHVLVCVPDVKGRERDVAQGLRYTLSLLPTFDRAEGLKDQAEKHLTQRMRNAREYLDQMSARGMGGGLTPKASASRRRYFEDNVNELSDVHREINEINSKSLGAYKRGSQRSAVLSRLKGLRQREEDLLKAIGKEKKTNEYEEKHFSFAFMEAEVGNIANTLNEG